MVGESLKRLRSERKLTQEDLAKLLGVSRQAICMWEANKRELRASMLKKIGKVFEVSIDEIIKTGRNFIGAKETTLATKNTKKKVGFQLSAPGAMIVKVTGDFTSWNEKGVSLKKGKTGTWKTSVTLRPGRYEYKFIVDGQWWTDPSNANSVGNNFGTINSVLEVATK